MTKGDALAKKVKTVRDLIDSKMLDIAQILPEHMSADRFLRLVMNEFRKNPRLLDCTPTSLIGALMLCAQTGLEPGPLGHAYLVPFKNNKTKKLEVQFLPGYRGLLQLVRNSGEIVNVFAEVVYTNDKFNYVLGVDGYIEHKPTLLGDRGQLLATYAVAKFKDGGHAFLVLPEMEVQKIRKASTARSGPWYDWESEMWKKSALKRLSKVLPMRIEDQRKIAQDGAIKNIESFDALKADPSAILDMPDEADYTKEAESKLKKPIRKTDKGDGCPTKAEPEAAEPAKEALELNGQTEDELKAEIERIDKLKAEDEEKATAEGRDLDYEKQE